MKKFSSILHKDTPDHAKTPLYQHIQQLNDSQKRAIGALYVIASKSWIKSKKKKFKMIDFLSERDQKELMTLLEFNEVSPMGFSIKLSPSTKELTLWHYLNYVLLEEKKYDARMRTSLMKLAHEMEIDTVEVAEGEYKIGLQLQHAMQELESIKNHKKSSATSGRWWKLGGAALIGGGLIAITGGIAAPVIIPALVGVLGLVAAGGTALGIGSGVVILTGAATGIITFGGIPLVVGVFGAAGGGLTALKFDTRLRGITHFKFAKVVSNEQARILLCVSQKMARDQKVLKDEIDRLEKEKKTGKPQPKPKPKSSQHTDVDCLSEEVASGAACFTHRHSHPAQKEGDVLPQSTAPSVAQSETNSTAQPPPSVQVPSPRHKEDRLLEDIKANHKGMQVFIGVWGCLNYHMVNSKIGAREFSLKWKDLGVCAPFAEHYALEWEPKILSKLGHSIRDFVLSELGGQIFKLWLTAVSATASIALSAVMGPLVVLKAFKLLNNPWTLAVNRSIKTGKVLAAVLKERAQGNRPVSLIGVGIGARVIFEALHILALDGDEGVGIVENVYLIGAAVESHAVSKWERVRKSVSGRLVNAYCKKDWVLAFLFRSLELSSSVAGLAEIRHSNVENICLDDICNGYASYEDPVIFRKVLKKLKLMRGLQLPPDVEEETEESNHATEEVKEVNKKMEELRKQNENKSTDEVADELQDEAEKLAREIETQNKEVARSENDSEFATPEGEEEEEEEITPSVATTPQPSEEKSSIKSSHSSTTSQDNLSQ
mmetsp:Transcript_3953/g.14949  ORF Transcript_3953/g.14949 Transcript_3953/m.14949 type:complete len:772 (-) Transcript_3953:117-2432(-)